MGGIICSNTKDINEVQQTKKEKDVVEEEKNLPTKKNIADEGTEKPNEEEDSSEEYIDQKMKEMIEKYKEGLYSDLVKIGRTLWSNRYRNETFQNHCSSDPFVSIYVKGLRELKRNKEVVDIYREVLSYQRNNKNVDRIRKELAFSLNSLAWEYIDSGKKLEDMDEDPLALAQEAIQYDPNNEWVQNLNGVALIHHKRYMDASEFLKKSLSQFPTNSFIKKNLIDSLCLCATFLCNESNEGEKALEILKQNIEYFEKDEEILKALKKTFCDVCISHGFKLGESCKWSEAEVVARNCLELFPEEITPHTQLNYYLREQGKNEEALDRITRLYARYHEDERVRDSMVFSLTAISTSHVIQNQCTEESLKHSMKALEIKESEHTVLVYSSVLVKLQKFLECINFLKEKIDKYHQNEKFKLFLTVSIEGYASKSEKFQEYIEYTEELLNTRYPDDPVVLQCLGSLTTKLSHRYKREGKDDMFALTFEKANVFLRKGFKIFEKQNPNRPKVLNLPFPVKGCFQVVMCFDSGGTHSGVGKYCYDFVHVDPNTLSHIKQGTLGEKNDDYITFGEPVYSVTDGKVIEVIDHIEDVKIGQPMFERSNHIYVESDDGILALYVHNKQYSATVKSGDMVKVGDKLCAVGNSGHSFVAHLHFGLFDKEWKSIYFEFVPTKVKRNDEFIMTSDPLQLSDVVFF